MFMRPDSVTMATGRYHDIPLPVRGFAAGPLRVVSGHVAILTVLVAGVQIACAQNLPQSVLTNPVPQGSPTPRILPPTPPGVSPEEIELPPVGPAAPISGPPV